MTNDANHNHETDVTPKGHMAGLVFLTVLLIAVAAGVVLLPVLGDMGKLKPLMEEPSAYLQVTGNLHPLVLHLPIGMAVGALMLEMGGWLSFGRWKPATTMLVFFGVVTSILANFTGYLKLQYDGLTGEDWDHHMWSGLAFTAVLTLALISRLWSNRAGSKNPIFGILLLLSVGVMSYGAHIGGEKVHPDTFKPLMTVAAIKEEALEKAAEEAIPAKAPADRLAYAEVVVPILEAKCYDCHASDTKDKGDLLLDSIPTMLLGGSESEALVPGSLEDSYMITVIHLPLEDDMRMPPKKKPQLDDAERAILDWWVEKGVKLKEGTEELLDGTLKDLEAPAAIIEAVSSLVSPAEAAAARKAAAAANAAEEKAMEEARGSVEDALVELKKDPDFENSVNFIAQDSPLLELTTVSLRDKFTDDHLKKLKPVAGQLVDMNLSATSVTDAGMAELAPGLKVLEKLNLSETKVTDQGVAALSTVGSLEALNLHSTAVTDEGVAGLKSLTKLKRVYLWNTAASKEAAAKLKDTLPKLEVDFGVDAEALAAMKAAEHAKKAEEDKKAAEAKKAEEMEKAEKKKAEAAKKAEEKKKAEEAEIAVEDAKKLEEPEGPEAPGPAEEETQENQGPGNAGEDVEPQEADAPEANF